MPELYFEPGQFQTALDNWIHLNTPPNPTEPNRKPLLVPVIITRAAEVPYEGKLWTVADLEQEINYAQSKGVGQVHYTSRSLRAHAHGGPKDNVGDKAKGNQYKHRKLPPPANAPAGALPDPVVNSTAAGVMLSVPNTKVKYWAVWVEDANGNFGEPEIQHGRKSRVTGVASGRKVRVQASDRFDRKSPVVEFTFP